MCVYVYISVRVYVCVCMYVCRLRLHCHAVDQVWLLKKLSLASCACPRFLAIPGAVCCSEATEPACHAACGKELWVDVPRRESTLGNASEFLMRVTCLTLTNSSLGLVVGRGIVFFSISTRGAHGISRGAGGHAWHHPHMIMRIYVPSGGLL